MYFATGHRASTNVTFRSFCSKNVQTNTFMWGWAILYARCQALFVFMLCNGVNFLCVNPDLAKTCYSRRRHTMCCVDLGKPNLFEDRGRWNSFPNGSFLYQHSVALENFVSVWNSLRPSETGFYNQGEILAASISAMRWNSSAKQSSIYYHISVILIVSFFFHQLGSSSFIFQFTFIQLLRNTL